MDAKYNRVDLKYCDEIKCDGQLCPETKEISNDSAVVSDETKISETNDKTEQQRADKPKCVSSRAWERFQALQKRTDDVTRRSTEKRIKHLQKTIIDTVQDSFHTDEEKDILRDHDVKFGPPVNDGHPRGKEKDKISEVKAGTSSDTSNTKDWREVQSYLGVNDNLRETVSSRPQSGLERQLNVAIEAGDTQTAAKLSDKLATRNFGVKISEAVAARDFMKRKKEEDAFLESKKKKKLNWGFDHKQRWETKSNM